MPEEAPSELRVLTECAGGMEVEYPTTQVPVILLPSPQLVQVPSRQSLLTHFPSAGLPIAMGGCLPYSHQAWVDFRMVSAPGQGEGKGRDAVTSIGACSGLAPVSMWLAGTREDCQQHMHCSGHICFCPQRLEALVQSCQGVCATLQRAIESVKAVPQPVESGVSVPCQHLSSRILPVLPFLCLVHPTICCPAS